MAPVHYYSSPVLKVIFVWMFKIAQISWNIMKAYSVWRWLLCALSHWHTYKVLISISVGIIDWASFMRQLSFIRESHFFAEPLSSISDVSRAWATSSRRRCSRTWRWRTCVACSPTTCVPTRRCARPASTASQTCRRSCTTWRSSANCAPLAAARSSPPSWSVGGRWLMGGRWIPPMSIRRPSVIHLSSICRLSVILLSSVCHSSAIHLSFICRPSVIRLSFVCLFYHLCYLLINCHLTLYISYHIMVCLSHHWGSFPTYFLLCFTLDIFKKD